MLDLECLYMSMNELMHEFEMNYLRLNIWVCWVKFSGLVSMNYVQGSCIKKSRIK